MSSPYFDVASLAMSAGAMQKPGELAELLRLVDVTRPPRVVVELGSARGGTLRAWRAAWPDAFVIGVDRLPNPYGACDGHGAIVLHGDTRDEATRSTVASLVASSYGGPVDFLFVDADHHYDAVRADVEQYGPLVRPGGLIALHDVCHHPNQPDVGVEHYWAELRQRHAQWWALITEPADWGGIGVVAV